MVWYREVLKLFLPVQSQLDIESLASFSTLSNATWNLCGVLQLSCSLASFCVFQMEQRQWLCWEHVYWHDAVETCSATLRRCALKGPRLLCSPARLWTNQLALQRTYSSCPCRQLCSSIEETSQGFPVATSHYPSLFSQFPFQKWKVPNR